MHTERKREREEEKERERDSVHYKLGMFPNPNTLFGKATNNTMETHILPQVALYYLRGTNRFHD